MRHYEGGTTHLRLLHRRLQHGTSLPVLHQCPWRDIDGTLPNTPHVSIQSPTWLNYKGKLRTLVCRSCRLIWQGVEDTRRRSLCRLRDAEVIDSYTATAEYSRETFPPFLAKQANTPGRKNKKIQVYGKGTAPPILWQKL